MKIKEKILTFDFAVLNKKVYFFLVFFSAIVLLPMVSGSEDLEVRTYYPYPYASYKYLTVTDVLELGSYNHLDRIRVGNIIQGARTFQGIESKENLYLQSNTDINIASNIQLTVGGRESIIGRFCQWQSITNPQCKNLRGGVSKWQPVILAWRRSNNSYSTYYNHPSQNSQANYNLHNRVLCCRIEDPNR
jgi:hypothetical protein